MKNVVAKFCDLAQESPDAVAWVEGGDRYTFREAHALVAELKARLEVIGVRQGDRVAVFGRPSVMAFASFLAICAVGGIYVGLNPKYTPAELSRVLADCAPRYVLVLESTSENVAKVYSADELSGINTGVLCIEEIGLLAQGNWADLSNDIRPDAVAAIVYTSGSTGAPKGAMLPHRGIAAISQVVNHPDRFGGRKRGVVLCNLPINHVGYLIDICTNSTFAGSILVFQPEFRPAQVLDAIEGERVTLLGGVPAMFMALVQEPGFDLTDYSSLEKVVVAGNSPSEALVQALIQTTRAVVMNGYGLTEAMGFSSFTSPGDSAAVVAATVGRIPDDIEWRIAGTVSDGIGEQVGEIQLRGATVFAGYFRREEETAAAFTEDGWLRTGDIARVREDGYLELVGRLKQMFKSGGYNVYPAEVERALESLPEVAFACVVSVPDDVYGEIGIAFVVPAHPHATEQDILVGARKQLANYKVPKRICLREDLPLLPIGKVDRTALTDEAQRLRLAMEVR